MGRMVGRVILVILAVMFAGQAGAFAADWWETIKISGDLRYRYEDIKDDSATDDNSRHRVRARLGLTASPKEDFEVGLRLATGSTDPVSTNQSLDGGFSKKAVILDKAYLKWSPKDTGLSVTAGKMDNPFRSAVGSDLVWDGDLTPEGLAVQYSRKMESVEPFANIGYMQVSQFATDDEDATLFGVQGGASFKLSEVKITAGVGYFTYGNCKDHTTFYSSTNSYGNTAAPGLLYVYDYNEIDAFLEVGFKIAGQPVKIGADYVKNSDPDDDATGYLFGLSVGDDKGAGKVKLAYNYRLLERDAVLGAFTDSDSGGGGTDVKGSKISLSVGVNDKATFGITYFANITGIYDGGLQEAPGRFLGEVLGGRLGYRWGRKRALPIP
jgi:hypothetical protein